MAELKTPWLNLKFIVKIKHGRWSVEYKHVFTLRSVPICVIQVIYRKNQEIELVCLN